MQIEIDGKKYPISKGGLKLTGILQQCGIPFSLPCGGKGRCGKCRVQFLNVAEGSKSSFPNNKAVSEKNPLLPKITEADRHFFSETELAEGYRLACQCEIDEEEKGILKLRLLNEESILNLRLPSGENILNQRLPSGEIILNPRTSSKRNMLIKISTNQLMLKESRGELLDDSSINIAADIGTTTIALSLLLNGKRVSIFTAENPQRRFGADVLSRITVAEDESVAVKMREELQNVVETGINEVCGEAGISVEEVNWIVFAGNTLMGHFLTGQDVQPLGVAPFYAGDITLQRLAFGKRNGWLLPGISAFIGGDIVAGIYALDMDRLEKTSLLLDLGTNGEMVLGGRAGFFCASAAAGPAVEAANISCGMASIPGAITNVSPNEKMRNSHTQTATPKEFCVYGTGVSFKVTTIGNARPRGICGSGLIEAVNELRRAGILDGHGTFIDERYREEGYPIWQLSQVFQIRLLQEDIRQLQLAKAAIRAGISALLSAAGIQEEDVASVYLAGGFGSGIDAEKAVGIGLLPHAWKNRVTAVGNTSLAGAEKFARSGGKDGKRLNEICQNAKEIRLAETKTFAEAYVKEMEL